MKKNQYLLLIFVLLVTSISMYAIRYFGARKGNKDVSTCHLEATEIKRSAVMNKNNEKLNNEEIRKPAVSGMFYTESKKELISQINSFLEMVPQQTIDGEILALISPHAGYVYSGQVAAYGFSLLKGNIFDTVIIIGPNHRLKGFYGTSVYDKGYFETPLGLVKIDEEIARLLLRNEPALVTDERAHQYEHSLEVQLPFLQVLLDSFKIVPIVMGDYSIKSCQELANGLVKTIKDTPQKKILLLISTDLSHYHSYNTAKSMDALCIQDILNLNEKKLYDHNRSRTTEMCGYGPVLTSIMVAKELKSTSAKLLHYANSGDVTNDTSQVVGYASIVLYKALKEEEAKDNKKNKKGKGIVYNETERKELLQIARSSIETYLKDKKKIIINTKNEKFLKKRGAFVTLNKFGQLRGCIGYIIPVKSLYETIQEMAINAAIHDTRFRPVTEEELADIDIEISVLSPLEKITDITRIEVGRHGIIIKKGFYSGLLLPQVATEYGWDRKTFLEHTCRKAGLVPDAYKEGAEIQIFSAEVFGEKER
ncbi:AmmeMemoRadiSam system protein B [Chlamydiota bacterium]